MSSTCQALAPQRGSVGDVKNEPNAVLNERGTRISSIAESPAPPPVVVDLTLSDEQDPSQRDDEDTSEDESGDGSEDEDAEDDALPADTLATLTQDNRTRRDGQPDEDAKLDLSCCVGSAYNEASADWHEGRQEKRKQQFLKRRVYAFKSEEEISEPLRSLVKNYTEVRRGPLRDDEDDYPTTRLRRPIAEQSVDIAEQTLDIAFDKRMMKTLLDHRPFVVHEDNPQEELVMIVSSELTGAEEFLPGQNGVRFELLRPSLPVHIAPSILAATMPSQLRLRAMAAESAAARRALPPTPARSPVRTLRSRVVMPPASATLSVMRSIQESIDAHREQAAPAIAAGSGSDLADPDDDNDRRSPAKRPRTEQTVFAYPPHPQPANAVVDVRDGRTKIYVSGYEFTRANITRIKITYRCSFYRSQECPAKLVFYASLMNYDFPNMVPHTCTPPSRSTLVLDESASTLVVKASMQREVDRLATASAGTPQEIWEKVSTFFYNRDDNVVVRGLNKAQVVKRVHRTRAAHFGSEVHGRVEVRPLSLVKHTTLNFFQFHHVWSNPTLKTESMIDRLVGWAHPSNISLLRYGRITLFIDATFRCVPAHFRQCVVVMVYDEGSKLYVPVFYVLAASKTYEAYWNILQYVRDACGQLINPHQVVCDFEFALIGAVREWFPEADIVGCFFHFKQACSRKMAKLHIPKAEIHIAMEKGVLDMLTVVDRAKIAGQGVSWVRSRIRARCAEESVSYSKRKWRQFWTYFSRTWLTLQPPQVWNVHGLQRSVVARTNNPLERFNRELNAAFGTPHPSLIRFVQTIEEISRRYVKLRDDIARGVAAPPRRDTQAELPTPVTLPDEYLSSDDDDDDDSEDDDDGDDASDRAEGSDSDEEAIVDDGEVDV